METPYKRQLQQLIASHDHKLSIMKPSEFSVAKRVMTSETSPFPGAFSYDRTPYLIEPVNCLSADHPARIIAVMKGAQIGFSTGVIESGIGYIISEDPGNILFLAGDKELVKESVTGKIDQMIDSCGLRPLIKPNVIRKRNIRTGDTDHSKEFPGGRLIADSTQNANKFRQRSMKYGFIDDFEAAPNSDKKAGSITSLIETRFAAYYDDMKLYYISTPEVKQNSNIEPVYLQGDQRRYNWPCPCCGEYIFLDWSIRVDGKYNAGITYKLNSIGQVVTGSVGYICQKCGKFFNDKDKHELNLLGEWIPTNVPIDPTHYSYHISALYAPAKMYDWAKYVSMWVKCSPVDGAVDIPALKTFYNTCLGKTWEERGKTPKADKIQGNTRNYDIGTIPNGLSIEDGNGHIILLTCACDLNGNEDDARLDYEIVGWSESGASYSIVHGSVGTFVSGMNDEQREDPNRKKWTYEHGYEHSVWEEFDKVVGGAYETETGLQMQIFMTGVDTGFHTDHAYQYVDTSVFDVVGLKGDVDKSRKINADTPMFKRAREKDGLFIVEVNQVKDKLADAMKLKWSEKSGISQPHDFMNFPQPAGGLYNFKDFFKHFQSEKKTLEKNTEGVYVGGKWAKITSAAQNHMWDCRVYNIVLKEIVTYQICKDSKAPSIGWRNYVELFKATVGIK